MLFGEGQDAVDLLRSCCIGTLYRVSVNVRCCVYFEKMIGLNKHTDKLEFVAKCKKKSTFPLRGRWLIKFTFKNYIQ